MSDDKSKRRPEDASRVNVNEDYEVQYWCAKWGCTSDELKECVKKVGVMADKVAQCLGK
jgi:hypothetical protein